MLLLRRRDLDAGWERAIEIRSATRSSSLCKYTGPKRPTAVGNTAHGQHVPSAGMVAFSQESSSKAPLSRLIKSRISQPVQAENSLA